MLLDSVWSSQTTNLEAALQQEQQDDERNSKLLRPWPQASDAITAKIVRIRYLPLITSSRGRCPTRSERQLRHWLSVADGKIKWLRGRPARPRVRFMTMPWHRDSGPMRGGGHLEGQEVWYHSSSLHCDLKHIIVFTYDNIRLWNHNLWYRSTPLWYHTWFLTPEISQRCVVLMIPWLRLVTSSSYEWFKLHKVWFHQVLWNHTYDIIIGLWKRLWYHITYLWYH